MKKLQIGSLVFTAIWIVVLLIWLISGMLPDWIARMSGACMLFGIAAISFCTVQRKTDKK